MHAQATMQAQAAIEQSRKHFAEAEKAFGRKELQYANDQCNEALRVQGHCARTLRTSCKDIAQAQQMQATIQVQLATVERHYQDALSRFTSRDLLTAVRSCEDAQHIFPMHTGSMELRAQVKQELDLVEAHYTEAQEQFQRKDLLRAQSNCSRALDVFPTYTEAAQLHQQVNSALALADRHHDEAQSLFDQREFSGALVSTARALSVFATHGAAMELRWYACIEQAEYLQLQTQFSDAIKLFDQRFSALLRQPATKVASLPTKVGLCFLTRDKGVATLGRVAAAWNVDKLTVRLSPLRQP